MTVSLVELEQIRALTRAFLARFFENEIASGTDDLKISFFWLLSFLVVPGFLMPVGMVFTWNLIATIQGPEALRILSRNDKTLYLGFAMIASATIAAVTWNSLLTDRRDGLILGAMPVRPPVIVAAKLAALATYSCVVAAAMHALASLSFGLFLGAGNTFLFAVRGAAAHFIGAFSASVFVFLAVASFQGVVLACVGPRVFGRLSPLVQISIVGAITTALLSLPLVSGSVVHSLAGAGEHARAWVLHLPPLWFLGIYEWLLGTDDPILLRLATNGAVALLAVIVGTLASYPLAYRRVMLAVVEQAEAAERLTASRRLAQLVASSIGRHRDVQAVAQFILATLGRVERHRFVLAVSLGLAVFWVLPTWASVVGDVPNAPRADLLAIPFSMATFLLTGLRFALSLPSDLEAAWLFDITSPGRWHCRAAAERVMLLIVVLPFALTFGLMFWYLWGAEVALVHTATFVVVTGLLIHAMFWRYQGTPCADPWDPESLALGKWWLAYVAGFVAITLGISNLELLLIGSPGWTSSVIGSFLVAMAWLRWDSLRHVPAWRDEAESIAPGDLLGLN